MPVKINGATSGSVTLAAPATGTDVTVTLPTTALATTAGVDAAVAPMGLVAVAPTSIANSGGSASLSGYTVSFSGVSSVSLNGVFTGDYDNYRLVISAETSASATSLLFRFRVSGSDNSSAFYQQMTDGIQTDAGSANITGTGGTAANLGFLWNQRRFPVSLDVVNPNKAEASSAVGQSIGVNAADTLFASWNIHFFHNTDTVFDGFTLYPSTGTATGTVSVYGYRK